MKQQSDGLSGLKSVDVKVQPFTKQTWEGLARNYISNYEGNSEVSENIFIFKFKKKAKKKKALKYISH